MVTIVSQVRIRSGEVHAWEEVFRERAAAAGEQSGLRLRSTRRAGGRAGRAGIIGTWESREDWQRWHGHEAFLETRRQLEDVDDEKEQDRWHEVLVYERS